MPLQPGTTLGPYRVTAKIGEGGMGEVYRARDTKLDRDVALKVLPQAFTDDPDRLARFEREAKVLASLNHPNIGHIYGLEEAEGQKALVLELVEGLTLADRIAQGPLPVDEALPIAKQIAEALEAAHEAGVIHRDLKPANIKVREDGTVKVLDFGLAKAMQPDASDPGLSQSPTISLTAAATQMGMVIGTAAYMAPEQASGKVVDKRADIWAFGAVLYEMLTGTRPFVGEDVSKTLARVIDREPDWAALPDDVTPILNSFLRRCLQKDPKKRVRDIGDVSLAMEGAFEGVSSQSGEGRSVLMAMRPLWQRALPWAAGLVVAALAGLAAWNLKPSESRPVMRSAFAVPDGLTFRNTERNVVAISPVGRQFVYNATGGLYLRALDTLEARIIPGTEDVLTSPVFSPDGQSVAYYQDGQLRRISITGGASVALTSATNPLGMSWESDGTILYGQADGILQVSENGGESERLIDTGESGALAVGPQRLPGGDWVLFSLLPTADGTAQQEEFEIVVESPSSGERRVVRVGGSDARYVPTGHLVYGYGGVVYAAPFAVDRLEVTGGPVPVVEGVGTTRGFSGLAQFDTSGTGSLLYIPGSARGTTSDYTLALADRAGTVTPLGTTPGPYVHVRASPDGARLAVDSDDDEEAIVWIYEVGGESAIRRLTFEGGNRFPVWSPDGQRVAFQSDRDGDLAIFSQRIDGTGGMERLTTPEDGKAHIPESWSPDGTHLSFSVVENSEYSLWVLSFDEEGTINRFRDVQSVEPIGSAFSPDGLWIAYHSVFDQGQSLSTNSGVFVEPYPATGARYQVPKVFPDFQPFWSPDGTDLFYIGSTVSGQLAVTHTSTVSGVTFGSPEFVPFILTAGRLSGAGRAFDVLPDGRFVGPIAASEDGVIESADALEIRLVINWFEELKRLVPVN